MNAGTSPAGRRFAARHSDLIFAGLTRLDTAAAQIAEIKELARSYGREIRVFGRGHVVCEQRRAVRRRQTGCVEQVLDGQRHACARRGRACEPDALHQLVEMQVEERDADRAGEEEQKDAEEQPAEANVLARELRIHQITASSASAAKSSARYRSE